ncbi:MAG: phenylalanine--tRNA ligase subunit alpha [Candidatus Moranbacteria bacterium]|nr:phenylalanine--tRNA ligase subunit alpha [Candidatus Moranbacteria bacterium]
MLEQKILNIKSEFLGEIENVSDLDVLNDIRVKYLGRKSELGEALKGLKDLSVDEKKKIGPLANEVKNEIASKIDALEKNIKSQASLLKDRIDVTIPGKKKEVGHLHLITQIQSELIDIFSSMGFDVTDGVEIETEEYNFDKLNIPENHPARDAWDTFWIKGKDGERKALRPHTSPMQIHYMESHKPPFRVIAPGKCFRNEATDASHDHTFYQFEALVVGDDVNVGHFKNIAQQFFSMFFKKDVDVRIRPSFFPFTEPSFEFDISCTVCDGKGCSTCGRTGWIEIGGAGMVNQAVFEAAGYEKGRYQGFAWGFGIERIAMMRHKIDDIRLFHGGDLRFIKQF